jgi:hypothetical protein
MRERRFDLPWRRPANRPRRCPTTHHVTSAACVTPERLSGAILAGVLALRLSDAPLQQIFGLFYDPHPGVPRLSGHGRHKTAT